VGGPREGGSRTVAGDFGAIVTRGDETFAGEGGSGVGNALGRTAADADPEQNAQCVEPCLGEFGRGSAGSEPGSAVALRLAEQMSPTPGAGADA
jgi:hypothetical protein